VEAAVAGVSEVCVYDVREEGGFIQDI